MLPHTEQRKVGMGVSSIVGKKDRGRNRRSLQGEASLALNFVVSDRAGGGCIDHGADGALEEAWPHGDNLRN